MPAEFNNLYGEKMRYIALLRGINAGKNRRVDMKSLKNTFERLGCRNVSTYINSGNVIFESGDNKKTLRDNIENALLKEFGFEVPVLIKTNAEMKKVANVIPEHWRNDVTHRTDIAYLFNEIDSSKIIDELPVNRSFIEVRYVKGALYWNVDRKNYNKSNLNKLIRHDIYRHMTVRNVNTARFLGDIK